MALDDVVGELAVKIVPDTGGFANALKGEVGGATQSAIGGVSKFGAVGLAATVGITTGLVKLGATLDDQYDKIAVATGATGADLKALEGSFDSVAKNSTSSLDQVGTAIASVNQKLDLTGPTLEKVTDQYVDLAKITGEDLNAAIDSTSAVFNQFNITGDDASKMLDTLFQNAQAGGITVSELSDQLNKGGAVLGQFGLSLEESSGLIALLNKNGVTGTEVTRAFTRILQEAGKAGVAPTDALNFYSDAIKNATSDTEAAAIAIDAFGPRAGPKLAQQIRDGTLSLTDFQKALGAGTQSIDETEASTADAAESFQRLKNNLAISLGPAANKLFATFSDSASQMAPAIEGVVNALTPLIEAFASLPAPVLATIIGVLGAAAAMSKVIGPIVSVGKAISGLTTLLAANPWILLIAATIALVIIIVQNWDTIKAVVGAALQWIGDVLSSTLDTIQAIWNAVWGAIRDSFMLVWNVITTAVQTYINIWLTIIQTGLAVIQAVWDAVWNAIRTTVEAVWAFIQGVIAAGRSFIEAEINGVRNIIDGVTGAWNGLQDTVGKVWDWIVNKITWARDQVVKLIGEIKDKVSGALGPVGGLLNAAGGVLGNIPGFDTGGVVPGPIGAPRLILAHGGETVLPTHKAPMAGSTPQMVVQGPLVSLEGAVIRDDRDITLLAREIERERQRVLAGKG